MDGVYDCDPMKNPDALLHRMLSYGDVRTQKLRVMDETAITLCKENGVPVVVFNLMTPGNIVRAVMGDMSIGTTVCDTLVRLNAVVMLRLRTAALIASQRQCSVLLMQYIGRHAAQCHSSCCKRLKWDLGARLGVWSARHLNNIMCCSTGEQRLRR